MATVTTNEGSQEHDQKNMPALAIILMATNSSTGESNDLKDKTASFRDYLSSFQKQKRIVSLSAAIAKGDDIIFNQGFGWLDHAAEEPTTTETSYLVASISKTSSAATLIAMEVDGHINLQDEFNKLSNSDRQCIWLSTSGIIFGGGTLENGP